MPRSYRFFIAAACGLTILIAFGTGAYFGFLYAPIHKQYQDEAGYQSGQNGYRGPTQSLPDIAGLPGPVERAIANPRPHSGEDHEKRDLAAQEAAALWAFWMVVASLLSVFITTLGTILLYKQIVLTREAVEDTGKATRAMERQNDLVHQAQRAWLSISFHIAKFSESGGVLTIAYDVEFKNIGQTIAQSVWTFVKVSAEPSNFTDTLRSFRDEWRNPKGPSTRSLMPGESKCFTGLAKFRVDEMPWFGPSNDLCNIVINSAAFYHLAGMPDFKDRKITMRAARIGQADAIDALKVIISRKELLRRNFPVAVTVTGESITT